MGPAVVLADGRSQCVSDLTAVCGVRAAPNDRQVHAEGVAKPEAVPMSLVAGLKRSAMTVSVGRARWPGRETADGARVCR